MSPPPLPGSRAAPSKCMHGIHCKEPRTSRLLLQMQGSRKRSSLMQPIRSALMSTQCSKPLCLRFSARLAAKSATRASPTTSMISFRKLRACSAEARTPGESRLRDSSFSSGAPLARMSGTALRECTSDRTFDGKSTRGWKSEARRKDTANHNVAG